MKNEWNLSYTKNRNKTSSSYCMICTINTPYMDWNCTPLNNEQMQYTQ